MGDKLWQYCSLVGSDGECKQHPSSSGFFSGTLFKKTVNEHWEASFHQWDAVTVITFLHENKVRGDSRLCVCVCVCVCVCSCMCVVALVYVRARVCLCG